LVPHPVGASDDTVLLSGAHSPENLRDTVLGTYPPLNPSTGTRRRNGLRRPFLVLAVIFAAGFIAAELIKSISRTDNPAPPGYTTGSAENPDAMPRAHTAVPPDAYSGSDDYGFVPARSRLAALRARLDAQGYSGVKFRLDGGTLTLYGSVPTDYDRLTVQAFCLATLGLIPFNDDLALSDDGPAD
jgi:hypothetical protein